MGHWFLDMQVRGRCHEVRIVSLVQVVAVKILREAEFGSYNMDLDPSVYQKAVE